MFISCFGAEMRSCPGLVSPEGHLPACRRGGLSTDQLRVYKPRPFCPAAWPLPGNPSSPMAQSAAAARTAADNGHTDKHFWALALGSLGVVFGDIGTSPLYALREAVKASSGGPDAVPGILSLMVWTMLLIV